MKTKLFVNDVLLDIKFSETKKAFILSLDKEKRSVIYLTFHLFLDKDSSSSASFIVIQNGKK